MDNLQTIESLGFTLPTPAYLIGALLFGILGFAAYRYGKKTTQPTIRWLGFALMVYPYVVTATLPMYLVGTALCGAIYWFRRR